MTEIEKKAYASGQSEMRERICALIHQHHYYLAVTYHGRNSETALLIKNILHDIREDMAAEITEAQP
jgi:uncharacterized protein YchJ